MEWPFSGYLRIGALLPFLVGGGIWIYDWSRKRKVQGRNRKPTSGWEDILEEEETDKD